MTTRYKHTQIGYLLLILYSIVVLFLGYFCIMTNFHPLTLIGLIIVLIGLGIFSRLTIAVDDQMITIQFGLRIIRKTFPLKEIETYHGVKNPLVLWVGDKIYTARLAFQCLRFLSD